MRLSGASISSMLCVSNAPLTPLTLLNMLYLLCLLCVLCVLYLLSSLFCLFHSPDTLSNSSGSIVYLPIHSNALKSISLKRLSGSTCLTGFECLECSECSECLKCLRWFDWFKGFIHITP